MGLGMPIPDLSNKPGPGRPGWATGAYEFQFEVDGQVTFKADAAAGGGSFTVKWPNGSSQSYSGNNASITAPDATAGIVAINNKLDSGYCDEFAVTGGKDKVKKVISWGERPWRDLSNGFNACTNLTNIENTKLIGGANCNLTSLFINCTGLTDALCENWDLSSGCSMLYLFEGCTNLELLNLTGSKFATTGNSSYAFHDVGSATTNGCEFKMAGLDFTGSTVNNAGMYWFKLSKFKDGSNLSNWTFDSALNSFRGNEMFNSSIVNGTLDLSNWAWPNEIFPNFGNINNSLTSQNGSKIKLSNWDVSVVNNFSSAFTSCKVYELEGLSTWNACAGNANIYSMFRGATLMRIKPNDNFSNAFIASLTPTQAHEAFYLFSSSLQDSERGPSPNLNGFDFSNLTSSSTFGLKEFMRNIKVTDVPDFSNVTFSSTNTVSFENAFYQFDTTGTGSNSIFNFNPITVKPANFMTTFYFAHGLTEVNIGSNVNMSDLTNISGMFYAINHNTSATPFTNATFPTNADFSSLNNFGNWVAFAGQVLSPCQVDNFFRRLRATNNNSNVTANFYDCKVTEAPALVRSDVDYFDNTKGWNITLSTPDATLPFAYPAYMVDPASTTSLTPSLLPPVADRNFTSTNSSVTVDQTTGVLSWASNFEGFTTVRCTYANGCYNEVSVGVQVPTVLRRLIPAAGQTALFGFRGNQYIDWGDGTAETNSGTASHAYAAAGTGWGVWRTIKIFDKSATEKFTGFTANGNNYDRIDIMKFGSQVFDYCRFQGMFALGLRAEANNALNTTGLTSFESMFVSDNSYKSNARFADPNNSLGSWSTSTATGGGAITSFKNMFNGTGTLGRTILNDHSDFIWSFPAGTTATAGTYTGTIYGRNQSGTYTDYTIRWLVKVEGSGTVTLDNNNFQAIPNYMYTGRNMSVGDVIRIDSGSFGSLNNNITLTLTSDNILNPNQTPANFNNWDTSQVTDFSTMFGHNSSRTGGNRGNTVNFSNWNTSSAENFSGFAGQGNPGGLAGTDLAPKNVSAADSPTGSAYIAWDTSNVTNFSSFGFIGTNHLGILKYWRFNTTSNVNMSSMFYNINIQQYISDEPCKTQTIPASDSNNPFGVAYTAWNMDKCSSLSSFAYRQTSPPGLQVLTPALSSWQISDSLTSFTNFSRAYSGGFTFTPTVGQWDPSGLTGNQSWHSTRSGQAWKFSTSAYDNLLDINNGWGAHASTVNSGVTLNMGTSKYSGNNAVIGAATVNGTSTNLVASGSPFTSSMVGGIVTITSGTNNGEQAKITTFNSASSVTISRGINRQTETNTFTVDTTDAAKGRFALSDPDGPGWVITDGGKEVVFNPFKIQVRVPNGGLSFSFAKIISPSNVNATINWGDGQSSTINTVNSIPTHTYTNSTGSDVIYEIELNQGSDSAYCTGFRFDDNLDATSRAAVENITQWGDTSWVSMASAFKTCTNLDVTATDGPVITGNTNLTHSFGSCTSLVNSNGSIGNWDVSQLTALYVTFDGCTNFNVDISKWDTSSLGNMNNSFQNCTSFNQDLSTKYITAGNSPTGSAYWAWNTSSVSNMIATFKGATNFNCGSNANGLSNWNTSSATTMFEMFESSGYNKPLNTNLVPAASSYSGSDYVAWDVDNVVDFREMFRDNTSFNQDIGKWKFKSTGTIAFNYMLKGATAFAQDISTKTITAGNSPYGTQYTAWDVSRASSLTRVIAGTNVNVLLNWSVGQWSTYALHSWGGASAAGGLSVANYTDQIVKWANDVNAAGKSPTGIYAVINSDGATVPNYDSTRTYGSGFANAGRARSYLSLDVSVSGLSGFNGTYYYDYATGQYINENDSTLKFVYNTDESVWELQDEEGAQHSGSGGSQANGPTSATWSGFTVADASAGWSFNGTVTT